MLNELSKRFRGFLPVIIDVETGGIEPKKDALLELAAISTKMNEQGLLEIDKTYHYHIKPFEGGNLNPEALAFNKIIPDHPFRFAINEKEALTQLFAAIKQECQDKKCSRAVLVGHNAWFDQQFLNEAVIRTKLKNNPFHRFTSFDTATLGALIYGHTVLSKACELAHISHDSKQAHSALYDAECTAQLFCQMVNLWPLKK